MEIDDDVEWFEHEVRHVESMIDEDSSSTDEYFREMKKNEYGYVPGDEISPEKFTRLANRDDTEVKVETKKRRVTGTSRHTKDMVVEEVRSVKVKVFYKGGSSEG